MTKANFKDVMASAAAVVLRTIPSHAWRKRFAKRVGPYFDGCIANTAYGFPMLAQWQNNVNRIGFEGSYGIVERFIRAMPVDASYIDIGANQGFTSIMASRVLQKGRVTCFEPSQRTYEILSRNIELNGCDNVEAINKAVSIHSGSVFLDESDQGNTGAHHIAQSGAPILAGPVDVASVWDPSRFSGIFVKIDTEGYEFDVLKGLESVLQTGQVRGVIVEINADYLKRFDATPKDIYEYLASFNLEPEEGLRDGHYDEIFSLRVT